MAFDYTRITEENCPARWRRIAKYLKEEDLSQFNLLNSDYQDTLSYIYESDFDDTKTAIMRASLYAQTATSATFNISSYDVDTPVTFDMSKNDVVYGSPVSYPSSAASDIVLTNGRWADTGLTPGHHIKYAFAATDADGGEGSVVTVQVILQPAVPTGGAAATGAGAAGTIGLSWADMPGTVTYTYMYKAGTGLSAATISTTGTAASVSTNSATPALTYTHAVAEITDITCVEDTDRSLSGKYWTLSSPTVNYYTWYHIAAKSEITNFIFGAGGVSNADYDSKKIDLYIGTTLHRFWFNLTDGASSAPAAGGGTLHQVDITTASTTAQIASATSVAIALVAGFTSDYASGSTFNVTATAGVATDSTSDATPITVEVTTQGAAVSSNPAPGGTGIQVNITENASAIAVATATASAVAAIGTSLVFGTSRVDEVVTVTNLVAGAATNAADGDAGITADVTTAGSNSAGINYCFTVKSVNPGGSSAWATAFEGTTHA